MKPDAHASEKVLQRAIAQGLLPADAQWPHDDSRPWPVLLLTSLGAWLAVLPLLGGIALLLGDALLQSGPALYVFGVGLLVASVLILRQHGLALFIEQLFLPAMVLGLCCLGWALFRDAPVAIAAIAMCIVSVVLAWFTPLAWLRILLGFMLGAFLMVAFMAQIYDPDIFSSNRLHGRLWLYAHLAMALWLAVLYALPQLGSARIGSLLTSLADGWCEQLLSMLVYLAGSSFLVGGMLAGSGFEQTSGTPGVIDWLQAAVSAACAVAAVALLATRWPALRQTPALGLGVALLLVALCGLLPGLGAASLCTAALAVSGRWQLAALGGAVMLWIVGSFYYALAWSLADKALLLVAIGAALGALAWSARRRPEPDAALSLSSTATKNRWLTLIAMTGVATLAVANWAIFEKENTIRNGQPVYVRLAPVDPRSLMQGDYMRLDFALPGELRWAGGQGRGDRPSVLVRPDPALPSTYTLVDAARDEARQPTDLEVPLSAKDGRWVFVTDAWFFKEGEADKFATARYGEFRILPNGSALLVGMADERLQPLR